MSGLQPENMARLDEMRKHIKLQQWQEAQRAVNRIIGYLQQIAQRELNKAIASTPPASTQTKTPPA